MIVDRLIPLFCFGLLLANASRLNAAPPKTEAEVTPTTLPSAESFIYREWSPEPMRLHVFKPAGWKPNDQRPALVFFFGGGWSRGTPERSAPWAKYAASLGFVGIAPDYRTKGRFDTSPLESVADGRAALRWVEDHMKELGLDPRRIVVAGSSAGGHVALWTAITKAPPGSEPERSPRFKPAALILLSAVSDTSPVTGYTPKRFGENAVALSPIDQLDRQMPPTLAFHGDADRTVPQAQALALRDKLLATGNVCEFVNVPGGSHAFATDLPEWKDKTKERIKTFLEKQGLITDSKK